ncbi:UbiA family prenyltransferase [Nocardioides pantholopis]|uniref:UbiA family prenyltransferase n=1 Tax=Nocardioides pantholopis TaxID=2483798 RepID=UPI000FD8B697|nr:UbiA family prenyltransferase [Nocardioides pantholopis]
MASQVPPVARGTSPPLALVRAAHPGPTVVVTTVAALLALAAHLPAPRAATVAAAVLAGQLTIGWGNDLRDAARDRHVGRSDKPLATGEVSPGVVLAALSVAGIAAVALSVPLGWRSAAVHLVLLVGAGHLYNLVLKATVWSWLPYAVAFGALPAVVLTAGDPPAWAPAWMVGAGAALGVGAHFLNAMPDLADDLATGVRGLPHRVGARGCRALAALLLTAATVLSVAGPPGPAPGWALLALLLVAVLAVGTLAGSGRTPFRAAMAIALIDVVLLVAVAR